MLDITRISDAGGCANQHLGLVLRGGSMFDAVRHNHHLSRLKFDRSVTEIDPKRPFDAKEELVLCFMMVPHELPLHLRKLDHLAIQFTDDLGTPVFGNPFERRRKIDLFHQGISISEDSGSYH